MLCNYCGAQRTDAAFYRQLTGEDNGGNGGGGGGGDGGGGGGSL
jgi:hypothetical protein